jgi:putative two-component system response regulator
MGFPEDQIDLLQKAAPMHDLGKIGIPDNILLKPGKLDDQEFFTMKTHPEIGAEILKDSPHALMQLAEKIALQHHEKWDGSGYPGGLKGEEIDLEVRIVSLADVFDALTTERPYKRAWSVEEALELIQRESGNHFDPHVVENFLACLPRLLEIKEQYAEEPVQEESINQA